MSQIHLIHRYACTVKIYHVKTGISMEITLTEKPVYTLGYLMDRLLNFPGAGTRLPVDASLWSANLSAETACPCLLNTDLLAGQDRTACAMPALFP